MSAYALLKFAHVLLAIVAVGFNASYGVWLARAAREPQHLPHVLRGIRALDTIANVSYGLLLVTGLALVWAGGLSLATFWIGAALVLYLLAILVGVVLYLPTARAQLRALEAEGPASGAYLRHARRGTRLGVVTSAIVVAIVFLMVTKPGL